MLRRVAPLLLCTVPATASAQQINAADSLWFKVTALTKYRQWTDLLLGPAKTWLFDPTVVSAGYDTVLRIRQPVPRPPRDSTEVTTLAKALGADVVLPTEVTCPERQTPWICNVKGQRLDPPGFLVAIGEPRQLGDSATIVVNRRPIETIGRNEIAAGRAGAVYSAFFTRQDGKWTMTCLTTVATDITLTYKQAVARCWTPPADR